MEPECSLSCLQQAAHLLHYAKPDNPVQSSSHFFKVPFNVRSYSCLDLPGGPFPSGMNTKNSVCLPPLPPRCIISRPSHGVPFDRLYSIWQGVQIIRTLITQFYATSFCDLFLSLLNLFQHPVLRNPKPMFFCQVEERNFTPAQTAGKILVLFVFNFCF